MSCLSIGGAYCKQSRESGTKKLHDAYCKGTYYRSHVFYLLIYDTYMSAGKMSMACLNIVS